MAWRGSRDCLSRDRARTVHVRPVSSAWRSAPHHLCNPNGKSVTRRRSSGPPAPGGCALTATSSLAHELPGLTRMALGKQSRNQRVSPRVDVLLRVKGELVPVGFPVRILNINRTGFAVLSDVRIRSGQRLHIRLTGPGASAIDVAAVAVHTQPRPTSPGVYMTGFEFQPEHPGADVPEAAIRTLLTTVAPAGFRV